MLKLINLVMLAFASLGATGQTMQYIDSIKSILGKETDPLGKFRKSEQLLYLYTSRGDLDSVPQYTSALFKIASQQKSDSLLMMSYLAWSFYLDFKTETKSELEYEFKALKIAEEKYPSELYLIYHNLGSAYEDISDYKASLGHFIKSQETQTPLSNAWRTNLYWHLSNVYLGLGKTDSALHYVQLSNEYSLKSPGKYLKAVIFSQTAAVYEQLGKNKMATNFYKNSIDTEFNSIKSYEDAWALGRYSKYLLRQNDLQPAKFYGLQGLTASISSQAKRPFLEVVGVLRKIYEALHQKDSAYYYSKLELAYRDSLFNQEKLNAVEEMTFSEDIRQKEEAIKKSQEIIRHEHNLQYAGITVGLISFVVLLLLFSNSVIVNAKTIEFFGVIGLLVFFEFVNLFIHPYLAHATNESPIPMLLALVCIAALLVPAHHFLQKWITQWLVQKNNRIRLAVAKKTVAQLEGQISEGE